MFTSAADNWYQKETKTKLEAVIRLNSVTTFAANKIRGIWLETVPETHLAAASAAADQRPLVYCGQRLDFKLHFLGFSSLVFFCHICATLYLVHWLHNKKILEDKNDEGKGGAESRMSGAR